MRVRTYMIILIVYYALSIEQSCTTYLSIWCLLSSYQALWYAPPRTLWLRPRPSGSSSWGGWGGRAGRNGRCTTGGCDDLKKSKNSPWYPTQTRQRTTNSACSENKYHFFDSSAFIIASDWIEVKRNEPKQLWLTPISNMELLVRSYVTYTFFRDWSCLC